MSPSDYHQAAFDKSIVHIATITVDRDTSYHSLPYIPVSWLVGSIDRLAQRRRPEEVDKADEIKRPKLVVRDLPIILKLCAHRSSTPQTEQENEVGAACQEVQG